MSEPTKFMAYAVLNRGEKLQKWEYEPTPLKVDEIEIRVTHNGLCHTDIHMRDNDWGISSYPLVPGHEVVGIVTQVGEKVTSIQKGDRVGFGWIRNSCRVCDYCLQGEENICRQGYTGLIVGNHGGFASQLRVRRILLIKFPIALIQLVLHRYCVQELPCTLPYEHISNTQGQKLAFWELGGWDI